MSIATSRKARILFVNKGGREGMRRQLAPFRLTNESCGGIMPNGKRQPDGCVGNCLRGKSEHHRAWVPVNGRWRKL